LGSHYLTHHPEAELADFVRWRMAVVLPTDSARAQLRRRFDRMNVRSLTRIVAFAELSGIGLEDVEPASAALRQQARVRTSDPEGAHWVLADLALNQGRPSEAVEAIQELETPRHDALWTHILNALLEEGDSTAAVNAVRLLRTATAGPAERNPADRAQRNVDLCVLGLWYAERTEWSGAQRARARLLEPGVEEHIFPAWPPAQVCAAMLEASVAVGRGRSDARIALGRADSLVRAGWIADVFMNLILARLWETEGDMSRALAAVRRRQYDDPDGPAYLATGLRMEGRLAALAGDRDAAVRAYTHYLALVNRPEPRVQPLVAQVREELARLVGEAPGRN
jgi:hypothetical protein